MASFAAACQCFAVARPKNFTPGACPQAQTELAYDSLSTPRAGHGQRGVNQNNMTDIVG